MKSLRGGRALLVVAGVALSGTPARAIFEDLEPSPRARALGGSYAGLSQDAQGVNYNPAGLVDAAEHELYMSLFYPHDLEFLRVNAISVVIPAGSWGTVGVGYSDFRAENDGTTLSIERTVTVSHGFRLMEDISSGLSFGYALHLYNLDYPTPSVGGFDLGSETTIGLDLGFVARLRERTTAGVFFTNVNNPEMGDPVATDLPQRVSGGVAYRPYEGVITAFEMEKELGEDIQFRGGVEFRVAEPLALRFGASSEPNVFDVGAGLSYGKADVDFTYAHHPVLNHTLHYGVGIAF
ncbi:MAG: hypothetical protein ACT4PE_13345 [Candidatus Eiseniibacteriota bacterium]